MKETNERMEMSEKEVRQCLFRLLCQLHDICKKNNIQYSLAHGTLLGAARHKGFIPWDDDIDVMMTVDNYKKFIELPCFYNSNSNENVSLLHFSENETSDYYYPFSKLTDCSTVIETRYLRDENGLWIDIFPVVSIPDKCVLYQLHFFKMKVFHRFISAAHRYRKNQTSVMEHLKQTICNICYKKRFYLVERMLKTAFLTTWDSTEKVSVVWGYGQKETFSKSVFAEYTEMEFEGKKFMAIADYNTYLTSVYGEWKKLPPVEKRVGHHYFSAYLKK